MNFSRNMRSIDLIQLCWFIRLRSIWKYTGNLFLNFTQSNKYCKENLCNILKFFYENFYIHSHHWLKNFMDGVHYACENFLIYFLWLLCMTIFVSFLCLFSTELNFFKNIHLWIDETSNQRKVVGSNFLNVKLNICVKFK